MAEAFGIAAGAIGVVSLSIQLAESLQKVKSFRASVKNASPQIEELIEEIEIMQDILSDLEVGSLGADMASSSKMQQCMKVGQRATKSFAAFAGELQTRVKKSKYRGGIKFALSRDDIRQMLDQLERTKSSLNLAYSLYREATAEDRHAALVQAISSSRSTVVQMKQSNVMLPQTQGTTTLTQSRPQVSRYKLLSGKKLFQMTTPEWLSNVIWQLEVRRSIAGLNIFVRTYGVVPCNAPVFIACENGDVGEMQRLFHKGLASPFDKDEYGYSLWQCANYGGYTEVSRLLSQYDPASIEPIQLVLSAPTILALGAPYAVSRESLATSARTLRESSLWLHDFCNETIDGATDYLPPGGDKLYLKVMQFLFRPPKESDGIWFWQCFDTPHRCLPCDTFSEEFGKEMLSQYVPGHHGGKTALQLSAVRLAYELCQNSLSVPLSLETMITLIIANGTDLHESNHCHTALSFFLSTFPMFQSGHTMDLEFTEVVDTRPRYLRRMLKAWLNILQRAGVDLIAYGAEESRWFQNYRSQQDPVPPFRVWRYYYWISSNEVFYFTISYGPTPEDWTVQLDPPIDQYLNGFWQMPGLLDQSEVRAIPGSWIDT